MAYMYLSYGCLYVNCMPAVLAVSLHQIFIIASCPLHIWPECTVLCCENSCAIGKVNVYFYTATSVSYLFWTFQLQGYVCKVLGLGHTTLFQDSGRTSHRGRSCFLITVMAVFRHLKVYCFQPHKNLWERLPIHGHAVWHIYNHKHIVPHLITHAFVVVSLSVLWLNS